MRRRRRRLYRLTAAAIAASLAMLAAATTSAVAAAATCPAQPTLSPFIAWGDPALYFEVGGGTFESMSELWALTGGASVGEPPVAREDTEGTGSLSLPPGGRAVSPSACVGLRDATFRFLYARSGPPASGSLRVEVGFAGFGGAQWWIPVRELAGSDSWRLSPILPVIANLVTLFTNGEPVAVSFRFTAVGSASWVIDDLYVDPYKRV